MEYAIPWFFYSLATLITVATSSVKRYWELDFFRQPAIGRKETEEKEKGKKENLISCAHRTKKRSLLRHRRDRKEGRKEANRQRRRRQNPKTKIFFPHTTPYREMREETGGSLVRPRLAF